MSDKYQEKGLEKTPEKAVGGDKTPEVTPENVGHLSGGEVNFLNISGKDEKAKE